MPFDPAKFNSYVEEKTKPVEAAPVTAPATEAGAPAFDPHAFNARVSERQGLVDPIKMEETKPGLLETAGNKALSGIAWVGDKLDRYVMGPSRAFVLAQTGPDSNFGAVPNRPDELRVGREPQAARRRVHVPRLARVRDRESLQLQGR